MPRQKRCSKCKRPAAELTNIPKTVTSKVTWHVCDDCYLDLVIGRIDDTVRHRHRR